MAKAVKLTDTEQVTAHIKKLDPSFGKIIETIRQIILKLTRRSANTSNGIIQAFITQEK